MPLLEVRELTVRYRTAGRSLTAVDRVEFHVDRGEILGVVGESGSGKSSVILSVLRLVPGEIDGGEIVLDGVDLRGLTPVEMRRARGKRLAYVPQAAMNSLNPVMTIGTQIDEALFLHNGVKGVEAHRRTCEALALVNLEPYVAARYPYELSGGMRQRAIIAMALAPGPQVVLADEPTSGLDVIVRVQILKLLRKLVSELGLALVLVSHDLRLVARWCNRALVMYAGRVVEEGPAARVFEDPQHPYTQALARSLPTLRGPMEVAMPIGGAPPDLTRPIAGCAFRPRCPQALEVCSWQNPQHLIVEPGRRASCHLHGA